MESVVSVCILSLPANDCIHFIICIYVIVSCFVDFHLMFSVTNFSSSSTSFTRASLPSLFGDSTKKFLHYQVTLNRKFHLECIQHLCDKHSNDVYDFFWCASVSCRYGFKLKTNVDCTIILRHNIPNA